MFVICRLVNGGIGTVDDMVWEEGTQDARNTPPQAILIAFDDWIHDNDGPFLYRRDTDNKPVVPIFRSRREYFVGNNSCERTQFPLTVAHAITIHKSQGITVDRAVLNINHKEFATGLSYVAVSRVKSLNGLLFEEPIDYEKLRKRSGGELAIMRIHDHERRKDQYI